MTSRNIALNSENKPLPFTHKRDVYAAWLLWLGFFVGICIKQIASDHQRTVTAAFHYGSAKWIEGGDIYTEGLHGFLYLPHAAIVYTPFHVLPNTPSELLWRLFCIGLFAIGLRQIALTAGKTAKVQMFPIMTFLTIPIALAAMGNGQMTLPMAGAMMIGMSTLAESKHWWTVFWLCLAVALKPLAIVLLLLAWALRPALWWRMPIGILILLAIPWLFQSPTYVLEAYQGFVDKAMTAGNPEGSMAFSDLFGMFRAWGYEATMSLGLGVRLLFAVLTLAFAYYIFRAHGPLYGIVMLFVLSVTYLMLFNPRTENNTYAAFAPAIAMVGAWAFLVGRRSALGFLVIIMVFLMALNYEITKHITPGREVWMIPLLTTIFAIYLLWAILVGPAPWQERRPVTSMSPAQ